MAVVGIDHVAFPTADAERLLVFYKALGFTVAGENEWRSGARPEFSLACGDCKISVHPETMVRLRGDPGYIRAPTAEAGCANLCFVWEGGVAALLHVLRENAVEPIRGPVRRIGGRSGGSAVGASVYFRDPDDNLIEFISYEEMDVNACPMPTGTHWWATSSE